jgi:hypothetical protein
MIEENIVVVAKKKSKQGVYKDPEKRKIYKALHAKETALKNKNKNEIEHNQSYLVIASNRLRQFSTDSILKDLFNWIMDKIQHVNTDILRINEYDSKSFEYQYEYEYDRTNYKYEYKYEYMQS